MNRFRRWLNQPVVLKYVLLPYVGLAAMAPFVVESSNDANHAVQDQKTAAAQRRAQLCQVFRQQHVDAVDEAYAATEDVVDQRESIRETRDFLKRVEGTAEGDTVLVGLIRQLQPQQQDELEKRERALDAAQDKALNAVPPDFCIPSAS